VADISFSFPFFNCLQ